MLFRNTLFRNLVFDGHRIRVVSALRSLALFLTTVGWAVGSNATWADDPTNQATAEVAPGEAMPAEVVAGDDVAGDAPASTSESRRRKVAAYLSGATFTGQFTVAGKSDSKPESYTISSCEPLEKADLYRLKVKIRYGDVDGEFPMDLQIKWADSTPVITLDAIWIPGLGTFSARVLLHQGRYAGTWQHDEKGGHLFGTIAKAP